MHLLKADELIFQIPVSALPKSSARRICPCQAHTVPAGSLVSSLCSISVITHSCEARADTLHFLSTQSRLAGPRPPPTGRRLRH